MHEHGRPRYVDSERHKRTHKRHTLHYASAKILIDKIFTKMLAIATAIPNLRVA